MELMNKYTKKRTRTNARTNGRTDRLSDIVLLELLIAAKKRAINCWKFSFVTFSNPFFFFSASAFSFLNRLNLFSCFFRRFIISSTTVVFITIVFTQVILSRFSSTTLPLATPPMPLMSALSVVSVTFNFPSSTSSRCMSVAVEHVSKAASTSSPPTSM